MCPQGAETSFGANEGVRVRTQQSSSRATQGFMAHGSWHDRYHSQMTYSNTAGCNSFGPSLSLVRVLSHTKMPDTYRTGNSFLVVTCYLIICHCSTYWGSWLFGSLWQKRISFCDFFVVVLFHVCRTGNYNTYSCTRPIKLPLNKESQPTILLPGALFWYSPAHYT